MALVEQCLERLDKTWVKAFDMRKLHGLHPKCAFSEWSDPAYRGERLEQWIVRIGVWQRFQRFFARGSSLE
jgi:hypothetical protein